LNGDIWKAKKKVEVAKINSKKSGTGGEKRGNGERGKKIVTGGPIEIKK